MPRQIANAGRRPPSSRVADISGVAVLTTAGNDRRRGAIGASAEAAPAAVGSSYPARGERRPGRRTKTPAPGSAVRAAADAGGS